MGGARKREEIRGGRNDRFASRFSGSTAELRWAIWEEQARVTSPGSLSESRAKMAKYVARGGGLALIWRRPLNVAGISNLVGVSSLAALQVYC